MYDEKNTFKEASARRGFHKLSVSLLLSSCAAATSLSLPGVALAQPKTGGSINVAILGEPPTLDPMTSTADVVSIVSQHYFETLYTFGKNWAVAPLLAESLPHCSDGGKTLTIPLRKGVKFHDGQTMKATDVVASLQRWVRVSVRGKGIADEIASISASGDNAVVIKLKNRLAQLPSLLAFSNSAAVIMPANKQPATLTQYIGTGPFVYAERKPDQYILLKRNTQYSARSEAANLYGGKRTAYLDEIRFVPVPNANTRVEGAVAGQFGYADQLPTEALNRIQGSAKSQPVVFQGFGMPLMFLNTKQGVMNNVALRRAVQTALKPSDMMTAAFGTKLFASANGAMYPTSFSWHNKAGLENYNQGNSAKAKADASAAGYDGKTVRIMASGQYDFHLKLAQVAAAQLRKAGFKVDLNVVDWATLVKNRADPGQWDIFFTHSPFLPEPSLNNYFNNASPGWWVTPEKDKLVDAFAREVNIKQRQAIFADIQKLVYEQVPIIKVGDFSVLNARAKNLGGFTPAVWPFFWNTWIEN